VAVPILVLKWITVFLVAFSALTLFVGWQEGHPVCKKVRGLWRWALVSPDGEAPSQIVCVSASVNFPLHHKVQKFSSGTGSPGLSWKKGCKMVVVWCGIDWLNFIGLHSVICKMVKLNNVTHVMHHQDQWQKSNKQYIGSHKSAPLTWHYTSISILSLGNLDNKIYDMHIKSV